MNVDGAKQLPVGGSARVVLGAFSSPEIHPQHVEHYPDSAADDDGAYEYTWEDFDEDEEFVEHHHHVWADDSDEDEDDEDEDDENEDYVDYDDEEVESEWVSTSSAIPRPVSPTADDSDDDDDNYLQPECEHSAVPMVTHAAADGGDASAGAPLVDDSDDDDVDHLHQPDPEHPVAPTTFVTGFPNHELEMTRVEDLHTADSIINVGFTMPSKWTTASAQGAPIPVGRARSGSSDVYGAIIIIVAVDPSPSVDTFGTSGRVRGRLRSTSSNDVAYQ